jgi:hypothetical protein
MSILEFTKKSFSIWEDITWVTPPAGDVNIYVNKKVFFYMI